MGNTLAKDHRGSGEFNPRYKPIHCGIDENLIQLYLHFQFIVIKPQAYVNNPTQCLCTVCVGMGWGGGGGGGWRESFEVPI